MLGAAKEVATTATSNRIMRISACGESAPQGRVESYGTNQALVLGGSGARVVLNRPALTPRAQVKSCDRFNISNRVWSKE